MGKTNGKKEVPHPDCCDGYAYNEAPFAQKCEEERIRKHNQQLLMWKFATALIVIFILLCTNVSVFSKVGELAKRLRLKNIEIATISADLGVERPNFLPLTDFEIKRVEEKEKAEREVFREGHEGSDVCVFTCKCGKEHTRKKCRYCGKKREKQYASHHER